MACKYHPNAVNFKKCRDCGNDFCSQCSDTAICLDCAAALANKIIGRSYIAAGLGFVGGLIVGIQEGGAMAVLGPFLLGYGFWGIYLGWQYGGRVWPWLGRLVDKIKDESWSFVAAIFFFAIRFTFSYFFGIFGGGIYAFIMCSRIKQKQAMLQSAARSV